MNHYIHPFVIGIVVKEPNSTAVFKEEKNKIMLDELRWGELRWGEVRW
jgi:hypothetical protein